jgi:uncharacterized protein (TIGR03663 family)
MRNGIFWGLVASALVVGLALRLARLDARPMHHDEANQAVKFGLLLKTGDYRYDASDHHGPTLYYLTLPVAWLRGQHSLAALDATTVRLVPALFGSALILLIAALARGPGRHAAVAAAFLAAASPALTYYARFYIQETAFTVFALAFLLAAGRYALTPRLRTALWAGLWAGLAVATKETWMIVLPGAAIAVVAAAAWSGAPRPDARAAGRHVAAALCVTLVVAALFYSSFLSHPGGMADWIRSFPVYRARGLGDGKHEEAWWYYLGLLAWSRSGGVLFTEALVLVLAGVGAVAAVGRRVDAAPGGPGGAFWPRTFVLYAALTAAAFSAIPYKTPWNLLPFYAGLVLVAACGAARLVALARWRALRVVVVACLAACTSQLGVQAWRASVRYGADPRNPYVYAHTTTDFLRLVSRIEALSAVHPDGSRMLVEVVAGPYELWPLPWYLRRLTRVGYWPHAADAHPLDRAPVIVSSQDQDEAVEASVGDRYVTEFYGLRPGVLLTLRIERGLWERFIGR